MKRIPVIAVLSFLVILAVQSQDRVKSMQCGQWRWTVKTLTDRQGAGLLTVKPVAKDFDQFLQAKAPRKLDTKSETDMNLPRFPSEKEVVEITAYITSISITEKDHDFQLVLKSPLSSNTCFAELPNPGCTTFDQFPEQRKLFGKTWNDMGAIMDKISSNSRPVKVKITGVPFWDAPNGERGASTTGLEIHPVLNIVVLPE